MGTAPGVADIVGTAFPSRGQLQRITAHETASGTSPAMMTAFDDNHITKAPLRVITTAGRRK
jgi:hypothetical protein